MGIPPLDPVFKNEQNGHSFSYFFLFPYRENGNLLIAFFLAKVVIFGLIEKKKTVKKVKE